MESLVTADWLADHLDEGVVLDCTVFLHPGDSDTGYRAESGHEKWAEAHIPGAGFADLTGALCDGESRYRFMVPSPEQFAQAIAELGVGDDVDVVLYDNNMTMWAARVWWMLRWIGFDRAAILDGGLRAWTAAGHPVSSDVSPTAAGSLTPKPRPDLIATKADVLAAIGDGSTCIIDALGEAQYRGEQNVYKKPGHIPGAINSPAVGLLDRETGCFRPEAELRAKFPGEHDGRVITYCGGGIAASADAFVLTRLGFTDVAVYTASLQEWVDDPDAPLVVS